MKLKLRNGEETCGGRKKGNVIAVRGREADLR